MLPSEDDRHVDSTVVEHVGPVFDHPDPGVLVDEFIFKVENVRIVWRDLDIHLCCCCCCWCWSWWWGWYSESQGCVSKLTVASVLLLVKLFLVTLVSVLRLPNFFFFFFFYHFGLWILATLIELITTPCFKKWKNYNFVTLDLHRLSNRLN